MYLKEVLNPIIEEWYLYFLENSKDKDPTSWELVEHLSQEELDTISDSVAIFQLGEYSEGKGLLAVTNYFQERYDLLDLVEVTKLFIKEEQYHSQLLKQFMTIHAIPLKKKSWRDSLFNILRKGVGYESSVTMLLTAEILALTYYTALRKCTKSELLQAICDKNLRDVLAHIRYSSAMLRAIRNNHFMPLRPLIYLRHKALFFITTFVMYGTHTSIFKRANFGFISFWKATSWNFKRWLKNPKKIKSLED